MDIELGKGKKVRRAYGFDEVALVPSLLTIDPEDCDVGISIGNVKLDIPIIASAMDSVVDVKIATLMSQNGGLGVLNLNGIQTRYENLDEIYQRIAKVSKDKYVELMQELYDNPIDNKLVAARITEIKKNGALAAVSSTPQTAEEFGKIAVASGCDLFFVQSTVVSPKHRSSKFKTLNLEEFCQKMKIPVILGNCVTFEVALQLMEIGVAGILVGIGPGAACTSRGVLGIGVPMATAIADAAQARDSFFKKTGRYVSVIGDGGMVVGGDICKAIACGADAVMIGSPIARAEEAPGYGFHWGMATPNATLPRGSRIFVGKNGSLKEILHGPARLDDGSQNMVGALKTSMGTLGAANIKEMQNVEVVIAPSILTEGKVYQRAQQLGMYK